MPENLLLQDTSNTKGLLNNLSKMGAIFNV